MRSYPVALVIFAATACGSPAVSPSLASPATGDGAPPVVTDHTTPACTPNPTATEDVAVTNAFGSLHGTLTIPTGCGAVPAVLIIAGSGPTDRDGNQGASVRTDTYRLLAEGLAARSVATLRYDKGFVGESRAAAPPTESAMRFDMGADDAALFVHKLRADSRVSRVVVAGHSEGSLLGMLVAGRAPIDAYVSLDGAGRPIGAILHEQLSKQLDAQSLTTADAIIAELQAGKTVAAVPASPPAFPALFRPSIQPYLISWMKYDPARELASFKAPALIVQGTTDIQVDVDDSKLLSAARPDATLLILDGMSHVLKAASLDASAQKRAYTDPTLPVVPDLIDRLAAFAKRGPS